MGKDLRSDGSGLESLVFPSASTALEPRFLSVQWVEYDSHACTRTQMEWQPRACHGELGILSQEQSQKDTLHFCGYPTSILWGKKPRSESDLPVVTLQNMAALGSGRGENSS